MNTTDTIGPLRHLVGVWHGDKGMDIAPESDGSNGETPYSETITIEEVGDLKNAGEQELGMVRYLQIVKRKSNGEVFHDETGYYMWDKKTGQIMQSLAIPRAVVVLAGGSFSENAGSYSFHVKAESGDGEWGIIEQPFMAEKASTKSFSHEISIEGDSLKYSETTMVDIYGKVFEHTDKNELTRQ